MIFVTSVPWLLRMSLIVMALFRNLYYTTEFSDGRKIIAFYSAGLVMFLATAFPSLVFSVRDRRLTTTYFVNSVAMHLLAYVLLCVSLKDVLYRHFTPFIAQLMTAHVYYCQYSFLGKNPNTLIYNDACRWMSLGLCGLLPLMLTTQHGYLNLNSIHAIALLFIGECMGVVALIYSMALRVLGDAFESAVGFAA